MVFLIVSLLGGMVFLAAGAQGIAHGGATLANNAGAAPRLIAFILSSLSSGLPTLATTLILAHAGQSTLATHLMLNSNQFQLLALLPVAAIVFPLSITKRIWRRDGIATLIAVSVVTAATFSPIPLPRWIGLVPFGLLLIHIGWVTRQEALLPPSQPAHSKSTLNQALQHPLAAIGFLAAGGIGLFLGSQLLATGTLSLLQTYQWNPSTAMFIGAVAINIPALAVALHHSSQHSNQHIIGTTLGGTMLNLLGTWGLITLIEGPQSLYLFQHSASTTLIAIILVLVLIRTDFKLTKAEAALLLATYALTFTL